MLDWSQAEKYYDQGNTAGFILSFLEAENILRNVLAEKKYPGRDTDEKIELAKGHLSAPQMFAHARALVGQLLELKLPKHIAEQSAEQILRTYFTAVTELSQVPASMIRKQKFRHYARAFKRLIGKILLYAVLAAFIIMLLTAFFSDTSWGKTVAEKFNQITTIVLYRAVPLMVALILAVAAIGGIIINRRRKKHVQANNR